MQLRSGRRLVYPPPAPKQQGGDHRRRSQQSSEDRISSLPEDLLLEILIRLRSVADAACAGAVSRRWRGLWTELPELTFLSDQPLSVQSTLTRITRPSLDLLNIYLWSNWDEDWDGQVSLLLHGAARLLPKKLIITIMWLTVADPVVDLPCFERTSYLSLNMMGIPIILPQYGEFTALKSLHLQSCCIHLCTLLHLCLCLRILNIKNCSDLGHAGMVIVHSTSLEEFSLEISNHDICCIDIAAPVLKEVTLEACIDISFTLSFSAPVVKKLRWGYTYSDVYVWFDQIWRLMRIKERELDEFHVVSMSIVTETPNDVLYTEWSIGQVIAHLPVAAFSILELNLETKEHTFGPMVLRLLRIQPTMKRLKVVLARDKVRVPCPVNCPCEHPINWRSEDVSLANLEVVEIRGLQGEDDEVDFLKIILRCATVLQRLTVTISDGVSPSNNGYEKIWSIMKEYPDVECHIMASGSEGILYP